MTPYAKAPAPSRSSGTIHLSWGLLTIPLAVYVGSEETRVVRKEFVDGKSDHPAGRAIIDKKTMQIVESSRIVKMAEAPNKSYVELTDDEIKSCTLEKGVAEIISFVPRSLSSEYVAEDIAQVRPPATKGVVNTSHAQAFTILITAMAHHDVNALIKFSLRGPARYGLLTPTGDLIYIKSADQVRQPLPLGLVPITDQHLELASELIRQVGIEDPEVLDDTAPKVQALIAAKASGTPAPAFPPPVPMGDDILAMLTKSVKQASEVKA